jgi:hypothetical protein
MSLFVHLRAMRRSNFINHTFLVRTVSINKRDSNALSQGRKADRNQKFSFSLVFI